MEYTATIMDDSEETSAEEQIHSGIRHLNIILLISVVLIVAIMIAKKKVDIKKRNIIIYERQEIHDEVEMID